LQPATVLAMTYLLWCNVVDGAMHAVGALHSTTRVFTTDVSLDIIMWRYWGRGHRPHPRALPHCCVPEADPERSRNTFA
jgi:hypothetical protein